MDEYSIIMKILLVNKYWYIRGGAEKAVLATKKLLEDAGHEVEIFGMRHPQNLFENKYFIDFVDYDKLNFIQKIKYGLAAIYNHEAKKRFSALLKDFKPDVIHFNNIYHQLSFSLIDVARAAKIKTVFTVHDYKILSPNYNLFHHNKIDESCAGGNYYRCLFNNCLENFGESMVATVEAYLKKWKNWSAQIDTFIAPSEFVRKKCIQYGLDGKKIITVPYPVDVNEWPQTKTDGDYVTFFGRLSSEKGVETFLEAAKLNSDIPFMIIGDGPQRAFLEQKKKVLGIDNMSFVGFKRGLELTELLSQARIVVVPSVWYEVSGLTILEAQAMGKVVLGSKIGAIPESVSEECLFEPKDGLTLAKLVKKWYSCPFAKRKEISEQLRGKVAEKHSPSQYLNALVDIYGRG